MSQTHEGQDPDTPPGTPGWVKALGVATVLLLLLFLILHLTGIAPIGH